MKAKKEPAMKIEVSGTCPDGVAIEIGTKDTPRHCWLAYDLNVVKLLYKHFDIVEPYLKLLPEPEAMQ